MVSRKRRKEIDFFFFNDLTLPNHVCVSGGFGRVGVTLGGRHDDRNGFGRGVVVRFRVRRQRSGHGRHQGPTGGEKRRTGLRLLPAAGRRRSGPDRQLPVQPAHRFPGPGQPGRAGRRCRTRTRGHRAARRRRYRAGNQGDQLPDAHAVHDVRRRRFPDRGPQRHRVRQAHVVPKRFRTEPVRRVRRTVITAVTANGREPNDVNMV